MLCDGCARHDARAAEAGGMTLAWRPAFATPDAVVEHGEQFWQPFHEHQLYSLLIAEKT